MIYNNRAALLIPLLGLKRWSVKYLVDVGSWLKSAIHYGQVVNAIRPVLGKIVLWGTVVGLNHGYDGFTVPPADNWGRLHVSWPDIPDLISIMDTGVSGRPLASRITWASTEVCRSLNLFLTLSKPDADCLSCKLQSCSSSTFHTTKAHTQINHRSKHDLQERSKRTCIWQGQESFATPTYGREAFGLIYIR